MDNYTAQAVWNFDSEELQTISQLKKLYVEYMHVWNLEDAYWILRSMWGEIDAKLNVKKRKSETEEGKKTEVEEEKTSEVEDAEAKMGALEIERNNYLTGKISNSVFYNDIETFYRYLCRKMKEHGLYFREGDDPTRAIFRR